MSENISNDFSEKRTLKQIFKDYFRKNKKEDYAQYGGYAAYRKPGKIAIHALPGQQHLVPHQIVRPDNLFYAAAKGMTTQVLRLLRGDSERDIKKANVDKADKLGMTPLMYAAQNGHNHIVDLLLAARADIDIRNNVKPKQPNFGYMPVGMGVRNPLGRQAPVPILAVSPRSQQRQRVLAVSPTNSIVSGVPPVTAYRQPTGYPGPQVAYGPPPVAKKQDPFSNIVSFFGGGDGEEEPKKQEYKGPTALSYAVIAGDEDIVKRLLSLGAKVGVRDLQEAQRMGKRSIFRLLRGPLPVPVGQVPGYPAPYLGPEHYANRDGFTPVVGNLQRRPKILRTI